MLRNHNRHRYIERINYQDIVHDTPIICNTQRGHEHGLRMNRGHHISKESIVICTTTAFACKTNFCGMVFEDV